MNEHMKKSEDTFYNVTRDGKLSLDVRGLLMSGKMNKQILAARELSRKSKDGGK